ncbi:MAG: hypothetical protein AAF430_23320 [Myxococcota bacterium]
MGPRSWLSAPLAIPAALSALLLGAIALDLSPLLRGPAPYPPEWRWGFRSEPMGPLSGLALMAGAALVALLAGVSTRALSRTRALGALAVATLLGWLYQLGLVQMADAASLPVSLAVRTTSPWYTGYFGVAASGLAADPLVFLRQHAEILPTLVGHMEHVPTHPPGAVLFFRAVLGFCQAFPGVAEALVALYGEGRNAIPPALLREGAAIPAAALLAPGLLALVAAATAFPVALLARQLGADRGVAVAIGVLWTLLPAPSLFVPQLDQLVTASCAVAVAGFLTAARCDLAAKRFGVAGFAGLAAGAAIFLSYGSAIYIALGGLWAAAVACDEKSALPRVAGAIAASVVAALLFQSVPVSLGHDPVASFEASMATHFGVYTSKRSYPLWTVFNLWDLSVFLTVPVVWAWGQRLRASAAQLRSQGVWGADARGARSACAALGLLLLLDVSGLVRGEIGRSWMPMMPMLLAAALAGPAAWDTARGLRLSAGHAAGLGALLVTTGFVLRISWSL